MKIWWWFCERRRTARLLREVGSGPAHYGRPVLDDRERWIRERLGP